MENIIANIRILDVVRLVHRYFIFVFRIVYVLIVYLLIIFMSIVIFPQEPKLIAGMFHLSVTIFLSSFTTYNLILTRVTLVEQELLTLPEHPTWNNINPTKQMRVNMNRTSF
jgi:hypothetical protein